MGKELYSSNNKLVQCVRNESNTLYLENKNSKVSIFCSFFNSNDSNGTVNDNSCFVVKKCLNSNGETMKPLNTCYYAGNEETQNYLNTNNFNPTNICDTLKINYYNLIYAFNFLLVIFAACFLYKYIKYHKNRQIKPKVTEEFVAHYSTKAPDYDEVVNKSVIGDKPFPSYDELLVKDCNSNVSHI